MGTGASFQDVPYDKENFQRFKLILENNDLQDSEKFVQFRQILSARTQSEPNPMNVPPSEETDQVSAPSLIITPNEDDQASTHNEDALASPLLPIITPNALEKEETPDLADAAYLTGNALENAGNGLLTGPTPTHKSECDERSRQIVQVNSHSV
uniref:AlNc14C86G5504 protein n=1 Tax=Albugo laibachii Nc14 TaxID=890382 RepID=F0WFW9_9STRA|nr:AlNc14C86G5504 [Albugo laibachii Nc14]|eukprot:CCA20103.1 AlNc14C86G5504 [Albugo laibachii Nc14]